MAEEQPGAMKKPTDDKTGKTRAARPPREGMRGRKEVGSIGTEGDPVFDLFVDASRIDKRFKAEYA